MPVPTSSAPAIDLDPFSAAFLDDPYAGHERMREAGPVVWLERYGIWAMARHAEVHQALNDWQTYCSARGVGLSDFAKEEPWRPPSIILEADPPLHTKSRTILARVLSPATMRRLRAGFEAEAERMVGRLVQRGTFDAIPDLAEAFPLSVFPDAMGLPAQGRENLIPYGSMAFNAFGPRNWLVDEAMAKAPPVVAWIMKHCERSELTPDGFGAEIYAATDRGELTEIEAGLLVRSLLTAGVDTTVNGIGNALLCFAHNPEQWRLLAADPSLARGAFEEALRYEAAVQTFFRTTTRAVDVGGVHLEEGQKVLLFLAAANRDPRRWPEPHVFDIRRAATGHAGFGAGIHGCVGQMLARLEGEVVLAALARTAATFEPAGPIKRRLNNTLRAVESLPVRVKAKPHSAIGASGARRGA